MRAHSKLRFSVRPTFPLDEEEIKRRTRVEKLAAPVNWIAMLALGGIGIVSGVDPSVIATGTAGLIAALSIYWKGQNAAVQAKIIREMVSDSNGLQDRELRRIMTVLSVTGHHHYAIALEKFLFMKQHIERDLHADGESPNAIKRDVERLVDELCVGVCKNLETATTRESEIADALTSHDPARLNALDKARHQSLEKIMRAYTTLCETHADLDKILDPLAGLKDPLADPLATSSERAAQERDLADITEQLQEENALARRVFARLKDGDDSDASETRTELVAMAED